MKLLCLPLYLSNGTSLRRGPVRVFRTRFFTVCLFGLLVALASNNVAVAQNENIAQELERLRRELSDVQRYIFKGEGAPPSSAAAVSGKPEPESNARLQRQMLEIQSQIRELTGHIERFQHEVRLISGRLDKLVTDVDHRLRALEGGAPLAEAEKPQNDPQSTVSPAPANRTTMVISSDGVTRTRPELTPNQGFLGHISDKDLADFRSGKPVQAAPRSATAGTSTQTAAPARQPAAQAAPAPGNVSSGNVTMTRAVRGGGLPEGTPQQQYNFAFAKLKQRNYTEAESTLGEFVDRHPDHPLAGNAMYWMGETHYVRKQYRDAARIFLDAYQRFPQGNKAADNLFKLARSLLQIGEKDSACTTYAELKKTFPNANARILSGAKADVKQLGCR